MIEIMDKVQQYLPHTTDKYTTVDGVPKADILEKCLFGGDQLTCARARSAKRHHQDSATPLEKLDGLEPVVEDWHTKMCLFEVRKSWSLKVIIYDS